MNYLTDIGKMNPCIRKAFLKKNGQQTIILYRVSMVTMPKRSLMLPFQEDMSLGVYKGKTT